MLPLVFRSSIRRAASWQAWSTPLKLTFRTRSRSSSLVSRTGLLCMIPATAASTSRRSQEVMAWWSCSRSVTSRGGGEWGGGGGGGPARVRDQGRRLVQSRRVEVGAVHGGARLGEQDGGRTADATRGAGDECGASGEVVRADGHGATVRALLTGRQLVVRREVLGSVPLGALRWGLGAGPVWQCGHQYVGRSREPSPWS